MTGIRNWTEATGETLPPWLTKEFVLAVKEQIRRLMGEWWALPFGQTMLLEFPADEAAE